MLTASEAILRQLADEGRHVLSDWRTLIFMRRATFQTPPSERRWSKLPRDISDIQPLIRQMAQRRAIEPIPGTHRLFRATVPYARGAVITEDELLMEIHPYAAISHLSALEFHGLTTELPKEITTTISADHSGGLLPIGTSDLDWQGIPMVLGRETLKIGRIPIRWRRVKPERFFGVRDYQPRGYPVRVTTPERTLIDGLDDPARCGGIENVLRAWSLASDRLDIDTLVYQVERFDVGILRQRVGFVLDEIGLSHELVEQWRSRTQRGGSSKLVASEPYAPDYSEIWNLSINAPISAIRE